MERIGINVSKHYDVVIGKGALSALGKEAAPVIKGRRAAIISDDTTSRLFGASAKASLKASGFSVSEFTLPHGEESKNAQNLISILEFLADEGLTRADCIVALGGGVIGDITGFAASCYLRGIPFIQVPTTLLAAVDSSVGGKTAINLRAGKNLAGAFYQPSLVLCDTDIISALPESIFSEGMAEVIKYGVLGSVKILDLCRSGAHKNLTALICECVKIKRDVVAEDEFDTGKRMLLNLGHTPAHAIEKLSDFRIPHGKAVAAGMCIMTRAACLSGLCENSVVQETEELCMQYNLPVNCDFLPHDMANVALSDKKRSSDSITLVLPIARGKSELLKVPVSDIEKYFKSGVEAI